MNQRSEETLLLIFGMVKDDEGSKKVEKAATRELPLKRE